jgi:hypothetical protein
MPLSNARCEHFLPEEVQNEQFEGQIGDIYGLLWPYRFVLGQFGGQYGENPVFDRCENQALLRVPGGPKIDHTRADQAIAKCECGSFPATGMHAQLWLPKRGSRPPKGTVPPSKGRYGETPVFDRCENQALLRVPGGPKIDHTRADQAIAKCECGSFPAAGMHATLLPPSGVGKSCATTPLGSVF